MKKTARKTRPTEATRPQLRATLGELARDEARAQLALGLRDLVREKLREFVISAGTAALTGVLEEERTQLVGPKYAHLPTRQARRSGSAPGELVMGGRRVQVRRPRARTLDGHEVQLPSWITFGAEDPLHERAVEQMLVGVSTRRYARSLEPLPADLPSRGTSRSAVSRRFVAATERQMGEWLGRDLGALDLGVVMIDGVHIEEHVLLVALGIDADGKKHVLGVREGATENAAACTAFLACHHRSLREPLPPGSPGTTGPPFQEEPCRSPREGAAIEVMEAGRSGGPERTTSATYARLDVRDLRRCGSRPETVWRCAGWTASSRGLWAAARAARSAPTARAWRATHTLALRVRKPDMMSAVRTL